MDPWTHEATPCARTPSEGRAWAGRALLSGRRGPFSGVMDSDPYSFPFFNPPAFCRGAEGGEYSSFSPSNPWGQVLLSHPGQPTAPQGAPSGPGSWAFHSPPPTHPHAPSQAQGFFFCLGNGGAVQMAVQLRLCWKGGCSWGCRPGHTGPRAATGLLFCAGSRALTPRGAGLSQQGEGSYLQPSHGPQSPNRPTVV